MTIPISEYVRQGYTPEHGRAANERAEQHAVRVQAASELAAVVTRQVAARTIPPGPPAEQAQPTSADVRAWAKANGVPCSKTGRIGVDTLTAYATAHP